MWVSTIKNCTTTQFFLCFFHFLYLLWRKENLDWSRMWCGRLIAVIYISCFLVPCASLPEVQSCIWQRQIRNRSCGQTDLHGSCLCFPRNNNTLIMFSIFFFFFFQGMYYMETAPFSITGTSSISSHFFLFSLGKTFLFENSCFFLSKLWLFFLFSDFNADKLGVNSWSKQAWYSKYRLILIFSPV